MSWTDWKPEPSCSKNGRIPESGRRALLSRSRQSRAGGWSGRGGAAASDSSLPTPGGGGGRLDLQPWNRTPTAVSALTRHNGRDSSSASLLTPPLSSRTVHRAFSQDLWLPSWAIHNEGFSSWARASGLSAAATASTWRQPSRVRRVNLCDHDAFVSVRNLFQPPFSWPF